MDSPHLKEAFRRHGDTLAATLSQAMGDVERGATILNAAAKNGHRLFICGNGGSAADSQHFAAEWLCRYQKERGPLPATALTTDTSAITAIGNDYGYEHVFRRQIEALGRKDDVLVAITTSGTSKNVITAITQARSQGMKIIALTGAGGAGLKKSVDVAVVIPSTEVARIQEMHELIYHAWCEYVDASAS